jgi:hypothetical protein
MKHNLTFKVDTRPFNKQETSPPDYIVVGLTVYNTKVYPKVSGLSR